MYNHLHSFKAFSTVRPPFLREEQVVAKRSIAVLMSALSHFYTYITNKTLGMPLGAHSRDCNIRDGLCTLAALGFVQAQMASLAVGMTFVNHKGVSLLSLCQSTWSRRL